MARLLLDSGAHALSLFNGYLHSVSPSAGCAGHRSVGWSVHQRTGGQTMDTHGVLRGQPESTRSEQHDWREVRIETPVGECMCIALTGLLFVFLCSAVTDHALLLSAPQYQAQCKHRRHPPDSPPPPTYSTGDSIAEYSDVCRLVSSSADRWTDGGHPRRPAWPA